MTHPVGDFLPHLILEKALHEPAAIAVRCGGEAMSYGVLSRRALMLAGRLRALGVGPESTVAILAPRSPDTVVGILGVLLAGGAYVPIDPDYPAELRAFMLADCAASVVLSSRAVAGNVPPLGAAHVLLDDVGAGKATPGALAEVAGEQLAYVIYTSGSTGRPKGVQVTHANLAFSNRARLDYYRRQPARFLLLSSFGFDSSVAGLFWTLSSGGTLVLPASGEERDPRAVAALIAAERITHTLCLPSVHTRVLETDADLATLQAVIVAGETCPASLPIAHARRLPDAGLFNEYGPTEATVWSTVAALVPVPVAVTIGRAIPGAHIQLLDECGNAVANGEPGEIHISGAGVARGYLGRPELTAERFITAASGGRMYKTGDHARVSPSGELEFLGRADRQVKLRGFRIELDAIEAELATCPDVEAAAVVVREDEPGAARLVAYLAPASCAIAAVRASLTAKLPAFMQPSAFVLLDVFPLMPNGKVDRASLPSPSRERPALESPYAAPRGPLERHLAAEWCAVLRLDSVGIHDRFFDLGGDSLRAATACSRLQETLGEPVFVVAIFEAPTIAQLATHLRQHYAAAVGRAFAENFPAPASAGRRLDPERLAAVRRMVVRAPFCTSISRPKNRRAIFILAPPRSGTTLLRAMLAAHSSLFTASELRLLGQPTLDASRPADEAIAGVRRQGRLEAIAAAQGCDPVEAARLLDSYESHSLDTAEFYAQLQRWIEPRLLVEKSPSYVLDPAALSHAEEIFEDAFYIHLARHPYEMIRSFERQRMDRIYLPQATDLSPREAGEAVWLMAHRNILDFLATIPARRYLDLRFSDLVAHPRESMMALCDALGLPFEPAMLDPYRDSRKPGGGRHTPDDPRFHEHRAIKPEIAEGWRGVLEDDFLSDLTWQLAEDLRVAENKSRTANLAALPASALPPDAIAIVGMSGRFPGARNVEEFWRNLCAGVESIRPFSDEELRASGIDPAIVAELGYVNAGAQIDDADQFAASFFGYTPREAELMDPQQRIFLECAWEAFEHAGCDVSRFDGAVGVFAGLALNDYFQFNLATRPEIEPLLGTYAMTLGNEKDFVATRVAHKLRLRGPAIGVQTACSTSLVALHLACQSLRSGESDMALVGGGRISVPLHAGYPYVDGGIPSPDGHCRAFDAEARGCVPANGIATVVVKRLADAMRDGDRIYSVIRGTAINNDAGDKAGFTAPSIAGQAAVVARAHIAAGVSAESIGYVEAHGTGTSLGDPIEIAALTRAFRKTTAATAFCRIGSVKTNIGHLDTGAGAAGLIKAALTLDRGLIPPSLHFQSPNPQIDFARSPFIVNAVLTHWPRAPLPRRAGISSFGIGGTNAHAVIEEAPILRSTPPTRSRQLLVLSARSASALDAATANLARYLCENPHAVLADVAHTLQTGRREFEYRRIVVARDTAEAARLLESKDARYVISGTVTTAAAEVAFMFPGQGAQYPGMARELYECEPVFRAAFQRCAEIVSPHIDLKIALDPATPLVETAIAQPAIFAVEYALARLWDSWGIRPSAMIGHSVGEFASACVAGVFSLEDTLNLIVGRARLMQAMPPGAMLAVRLAEGDLQPHLGDGVELAAINSPRLCVVSGPHNAIAAFAARMSERDVACVALRTSHAFHSAMVEEVGLPFAALMTGVKMHLPRIPMVSTLSGDAKADFTQPEYWMRQLREPVRFSDAVAAISKDRILLEVGPGATLTPLARQSRGGAVVASQAATGEREQASMLEALGRLWLAGVAIEWKFLHGDERRLRVALPTYPFERERYWLEPGRAERKSAERPARQAPSADEPQGEVASATAMDRVRDLLHEMSGLPVGKMPPSATLLELGFDSLFLTQVALAFRKKFGVEIAFRQLFEELSTVEALAAHVAASATSTEPARMPVAAIKAAPLAHGPFRPIQKDAADELSEPQREHLAALISRYTSRTATSKLRTQKDRAHFADPRSVSGFRPYWKELTYPLVVERSAGSKLWDADGNEYIDFTMGYGTNLLGHSPQFITDAIASQLARGIEIGPQSPVAGEIARMLCEFSGHERAAFTNTGSEAVLAAVRVARTVTGRARIATFSGYHGINDEFLIRGKTVDGVRRSMPIAPGIPDHIAEGVLALEYGASESLELLRAHAHELAAVLVEPVQSRHPNLQPREFLHEVRRITQETGVALVFDEVITGFRCHQGGAQAWFDVRADLVTYGKIIGGGMPMGALCGRRLYMDALDGGAWNFGDDSRPEAGVTFFAGTYVRHPLAMAASHAILKRLKESGLSLQSALNDRTAQIVRELNAFLEAHAAPIRIECFSSMFFVKFTDDFNFGGLLFFHLREKGIHAWDNRLLFLSTAHTEDDIAQFIRAFCDSVEEMKSGGFFATPHSPQRQCTSSCRGESDESAIVLPLTGAQRGLHAIANQHPDASRAYNESSALDLRGPLNVSALRTALESLVARHDALRTAFATGGDTLTIEPHVAVDILSIDCPAEDDLARQIAAVCALRFDLSRAPIMDLRLLRRSAEHHVLLITLHHTLCNGPSLVALFDDLCELYTASCGGTSPPLPQPMQLREYMQRRGKPVPAASEAFWKSQFSDAPPTLDLPLDHPRPTVKSNRGGRKVMVLDAACVAALRRAGAQHGASLFMTLLSGFQVLLHRLSGCDDVVVGVPFEGKERNEPGGQRLIANSTNVAPLRSRIEAGTTFVDLLTANRRLVLEATEHQDYFFGDLIAALNLPFDRSRSPLFNALFNYETGRYERDLDGLSLELVNDRVPYLGLRDTAMVEIYLNVAEHDGELVFRADYNSDLFDATTVERWLDHLRVLLAAIAEDSAQQIARLPLLSAAEREQMLTGWMGGALEFSPTATLHQIFEERVRICPDACAIRDRDRRISYRELNTQADAIAAQLQTLGVEKEAFVGVCMQRTWSMIAVLFGVLKAGAAYVPMDPAYPTERLAVILEDSRAAVVLCDEVTEQTHAATLARARWQQPWTSGTPKPSDVAGRNLAYLIYTSGSTGRPKGVALEHRNAVAFVHWARETFTPSELSGVLGSTSICFDVSIFEIFVPLAAGGTIYLVENVLALPQLEGAGEITIMSTVASAMAELLRNCKLPPSIRTVNLGGETVFPQLVDTICERSAVQRVVNLYGPTETTTYSTFSECRRGEAVAIGRPITNTDLYVLDAHMEPVPIGVVGELYIGGAGLARGYWGRPELTSERFLPSPFKSSERIYKTGDLVRWRADGELLCVGRSDQQLKVRGFRVEPGEIDGVLEKHPSVRECVTLGRRDTDGEMRLISFLVPTVKMAPVQDLRDHVRQSLPAYMVPAAFIEIAEMPHTASGKVDRRALPTSDLHEVVKSGATAPRTPVEEEVAALWEEVLGRTRVAVDDDFFNLGGHSLLAMRLLGRVREKFEVDLPVRNLFETPTVAGVARFIESRREAIAALSAARSLIPIQRGDPSRRPLFLVPGGWGGELEFLVYATFARHLGAEYPIYGFRARGFDGSIPPHRSVAEMAADYVAEIREMQPRGPYLICGECVGGIAAYEIARLLVEQGEEIALLALLDTTYPSGEGLRRFCSVERAEARERFWEVRVRQRLRGHVAKLAHLSVAGKVRYLCQRLLRVGRDTAAPVRIEARKFLEHYPRMLLGHSLPPYPGRVTLLIPRESRAGVQERGWSEATTAGIDIHILPGDHLTYIREHAGTAAAKLRELIEQTHPTIAC